MLASDIYQLQEFLPACFSDGTGDADSTELWGAQTRKLTSLSVKLFFQKKETLTCQVSVGSRADAAGVAAESPAFQQGSQGPWLTRRRCAPEPQGTALSVDATLSSNARTGGIQDLRRLSLHGLWFTGETPPGWRGQGHRARPSQLQEEQHQNVNAQEHVTLEVRDDLIPPKNFPAPSRDAVDLRRTVDSNSHKPRQSDNEAERRGWQPLLKSSSQWGKIRWGTWWRMLLFSFITTQLSTPHSSWHLTQTHSRTLMPLGHFAELQRFLQEHKSSAITVCVPSSFFFSPTGFSFFI